MGYSYPALEIMKVYIIVESPHQTKEVTHPVLIQINIINLVSYNMSIKKVP